jgi:predicted nucleic acid-binding protein
VTVHLDASVLVPLFAIDSLNSRAEKALRSLQNELIVSDLSAAEFSSVIARRVRTRDLRAEEARTAFLNFDIWCNRYSRLVNIERIDFSQAIGLMRRLELSLRTPDALHIAIAQRIGGTLLTFDKRMASAARVLGIDLMVG